MGQSKTILLEKLREALSSVLPIVLIVLVLCFSIAPIPTATLMTFLIGAVLLILYLKLVKRQKIRLRGIPPYLYAAGFLGVALVSTNAYCTPRIGVATAVALSVTGQMVLSAIIDHFGLLGMKKTAFKARRLPA